VYSGRTLNIDGSGALLARGGQNAAGIGSNKDNIASRINISGGLISATGGEDAAGIGGGDGQWGGYISISGGIVTARGGQYGAGIGGGRRGKANVSITGGSVYPMAGNGANAVGSGYKVSSSSSAKNTFGWAAIYNTTYDKVDPSAVNESDKPVFPVTFDLGMPSCNVTNIVIDKVGNPCKDIWTDEDGNLQEFQVLDVIEHDDATYYVLIDAEDEQDELSEVFVLRLVEDADDELVSTFDAVGDDEAHAIFELFRERNAEFFDFVDLGDRDEDED
jgi:uncharacterized protein YrzB (UPF0473 family)